MWGNKKGKRNVAPLQPPTLATFRSWGSSAGAGRIRLARKIIMFFGLLRYNPSMILQAKTYLLLAIFAANNLR